MQIKINNKQNEDLRQDLLYLIHDFLCRANLTQTSKCLKKEAQLIFNTQLCDNIDLEIILHHFIDYYVSKFNKMPKLRKKLQKPAFHQEYSRIHKSYSDIRTLPDWNSKKSVPNTLSIPDFFTITPFSRKTSIQVSTMKGCYQTDDSNNKIQFMIKNLYPDSSEFYYIAEMIMKEIISENLNIHWTDIFGLEEGKKLLRETIMYPVKYPEIFKGKFSSWQGILLYGPPGTGKTMLAKAVATECKWTFFNITASSLVSKWRGDSEKFIRILCELAVHYSPSIIFIDEIDWTTGNDINSEKNSEPLRRFRAELLTRFDGIISLERKDVTLLAATNTPWNLDTALLRRFEKQVLVDFPDERTRSQIMKYYTASDLHELAEFDLIIKNTQYYSGSDLKRLCKEAWMNQTIMYIENENKHEKSTNKLESRFYVINSVDFLNEALKTVYPTAKHLIKKYYNWKNKKNLILS